MVTAGCGGDRQRQNDSSSCSRRLPSVVAPIRRSLRSPVAAGYRSPWASSTPQAPSDSLGPELADDQDDFYRWTPFWIEFAPANREPLPELCSRKQDVDLGFRNAACWWLEYPKHGWHRVNEIPPPVCTAQKQNLVARDIVGLYASPYERG